MKKIKLTKEIKLIPLKHPEFALVDDRDFEVLKNIGWYALKLKDGYHAATLALMEGMVVLLAEKRGEPIPTKAWEDIRKRHELMRRFIRDPRKN